ncbi:hypothetical protein QM467_06110 [Rhodoblastus sp. 17X3]|uniref:hypothetical protein n=1 Tax=Rhodoblastus sp. 17X3 TaxID=3047026 RepID=UPI0024B73908|nr:hypothetical protein [Rhodoblastus sp. 17X3]MDI9847634.1 hypothetical protein [Rhodoblastus sp. 17X3]
MGLGEGRAHQISARGLAKYHADSDDGRALFGMCSLRPVSPGILSLTVSPPWLCVAPISLVEAGRMTLVAAWMDWTDQKSPRLLCQSDSRLSNTATKDKITDRTSKLFRLPLNLHRMSDQDFATAGGLRAPYFSSSVGMGYSGDTILALDVINVLSQTLPNLARQDEREELLNWEEIVQHAHVVIDGIVKGYEGIVDIQTEILIFGARPAAADFRKLGAHHFIIKSGRIIATDVDLYNDNCFAIGSAAPQFRAEAKVPVALWRQYRDAKNLYERATPEQHDGREIDLWSARRDICDHYKNAFSSVVNSTNRTVGGSIQMIETTPDFMVARKRKLGDLFDLPGIHQVGDFSVAVVTEL